ncbi:MAG TPA: acyl-CoA dehydrogenase family protein [Solirubrobacteraceae bacterium]|nr:acyl-CoA dehydrogenase family protein [Solirubrobacteraceae bacterium]
MDLSDTPEQAAFRARAREWLEAHRDEAPPRHGSHEDRAYIDARRAWQRRLAEAGLAGVTWPVEYGGQGLGPIEQVTANQEISRAGVPGILDVIGVGMLGPCLIAHGTEEQKARHLGPLLHADEVWCQLFSEPAAGSDLAGIHTRARQTDPDDAPSARLSEAGRRAGGNGVGGWSLTGQKVWTTNAQFASFGLLLARTDPDVPKHKGLTMFIVPMDAPGVSVRPLRQISGEAEFNEVFLDDVPLAPEAVVGGVGNGWATALTVLMFERLTIGFGSESYGSPDALAKLIAADPAAARDPEVRHRLGQVMSEFTAVRFNGYRALTLLARGRIPGPEAGLAKVTMVNAAITATDLAADVAGPDALAPDSQWAYLISFLPGLKSAGGTEAILRNTIGERVLGLPAEPRLDKGVPFSELRAREREEVA